MVDQRQAEGEVCGAAALQALPLAVCPPLTGRRVQQILNQRQDVLFCFGAFIQRTDRRLMAVNGNHVAGMPRSDRAIPANVASQVPNHLRLSSTHGVINESIFEFDRLRCVGRTLRVVVQPSPAAAATFQAADRSSKALQHADDDCFRDRPQLPLSPVGRFGR